MAGSITSVLPSADVALKMVNALVSDARALAVENEALKIEVASLKAELLRIRGDGSGS